MDQGSGKSDKKQPTIRRASGSPLYRWSFASAAGVPDQEARWLYEIQPEVEKFNLKLNKKKAASIKLQAWQWLKDTIGLLKRRNMKHLNEDHLKRIADILEEILKLVKKDMEPREKSKK